MSRQGRMSVPLEGAPPDSFPDVRMAGHWQIPVWGSALEKKLTDTDLWSPPAFLQGVPGTNPEHTQARSQPPRSLRAFS